MAAAPLPPDENERLRLLHALELLDSDPEPVFDRITRTLAQSLHVPIALVSLVDEQRQWFKSRVGLDATETPRDQAFCAHAILGSTTMLVDDAPADGRFADNPLVSGEPHIRFYAGAPIRTSGGLALGTLCAIDTVPRQLCAEELQLLDDLASIVSREIQLRETMLIARSELERSSAVLDASEARFRAVFENSSVGMALVAPDGGWISVNPALAQIVGYSPDELRGMTFQDITHPADLHSDLELLRQLSAGDIESYQLEKRYLRRDGSAVWIHLNVSKKLSSGGDIEYLIAVITDIQARREAEAALQQMRQGLEQRVEERTRQLSQANEALRSLIESQQQAENALRQREAELSAVIANANDAYVSLDQNGLVTNWNRVAEETFGWSAEEAIGRPLDQLIMPTEMATAHREGMARYLASGEQRVIGRRLEVPALRKDRTLLNVEVSIRTLEVDGKTIFSAFLHDITDRKATEAQREREARHDPLTGLFNRRALGELLPLAQARADRNKVPLALLFLDLDGFKAVNDSLGHDAGDELLREVAARLRQHTRQIDTPVRLAGDEFTLILENMHEGLEDARAVASKLLRALVEPITTSRGIATVSASIGVALHRPGCGIDATDLLRLADMQMYQAKHAGKGCIRPDSEA